MDTPISSAIRRLPVDSNFTRERTLYTSYLWAWYFYSTHMANSRQSFLGLSPWNVEQTMFEISIFSLAGIYGTCCQWKFVKSNPGGDRMESGSGEKVMVNSNLCHFSHSSSLHTSNRKTYQLNYAPINVLPRLPPNGGICMYDHWACPWFTHHYYHVAVLVQRHTHPNLTSWVSTRRCL